MVLGLTPVGKKTPHTRLFHVSSGMPVVNIVSISSPVYGPSVDCCVAGRSGRMYQYSLTDP